MPMLQTHRTMPHRADCQCPPCRYRRGEDKGQVPNFTIRLHPELIDWIRSRNEKPRAYIERLVREDIERQRPDEEP